MVTKEGDVTVGPILKHLADRAGVVYTGVDGDQPGLLMGLVFWARELGLEVLCGGNFQAAGLILDESTGTLTQRSNPVPLSDEAKRFLAPISSGQAGIISSSRLAVLGKVGKILHGDYEELTIVANATGMMPDVETLHHPVLRTVEIPEVLCPVKDGGILESQGIIDMVTCLRHADGPGGGGGVFVVVSPASEYSRYSMSIDILSNQQDSAYLIYSPYHLCGVETAISILCAALLDLSTGAIEYLPRFDVIARVTEDKKAVEVLDYEDVQMQIRPAGAVEEGAPLPLNMALWHKLAVDVSAGTIISKNELIPPPDSVLWKLRREQDNLFHGL
jgi:predicted homoserine dehydrogenase-like protein